TGDGDIDVAQHFEVAEAFGQAGECEFWSHAPAQSRVHGTSTRSIQLKPAVIAMPAVARMTTPANKSGMLKASADWLISRPSPAREPNNSATTTPVRPRQMPSFKPARIIGTADGSETL